MRQTASAEPPKLTRQTENTEPLMKISAVQEAVTSAHITQIIMKIQAVLIRPASSAQASFAQIAAVNASAATL